MWELVRVQQIFEARSTVPPPQEPFPSLEQRIPGQEQVWVLVLVPDSTKAQVQLLALPNLENQILVQERELERALER